MVFGRRQKLSTVVQRRRGINSESRALLLYNGALQMHSLIWIMCQFKKTRCKFTFTDAEAIKIQLLGCRSQKPAKINLKQKQCTSKFTLKELSDHKHGSHSNQACQGLREREKRLVNLFNDSGNQF